MIELKLNGNTYPIKDVLKELKFRWDQKEKAWTRTFDDSQEQYVNDLSGRWSDYGVYGTVTKR